MTAVLALQLIVALIGDMPELILDIKRVIAELEGKAGPGAPAAPVAPQVEAETKATADALAKPVG